MTTLFGIYLNIFYTTGTQFYEKISQRTSSTQIIVKEYSKNNESLKTKALFLHRLHLIMLYNVILSVAS